MGNAIKSSKLLKIIKMSQNTKVSRTSIQYKSFFASSSNRNSLNKNTLDNLGLKSILQYWTMKNKSYMSILTNP